MRNQKEEALRTKAVEAIRDMAKKLSDLAAERGTLNMIREAARLNPEGSNQFDMPAPMIEEARGFMRGYVVVMNSPDNDRVHKYAEVKKVVPDEGKGIAAVLIEFTPFLTDADISRDREAAVEMRDKLRERMPAEQHPRIQVLSYPDALSDELIDLDSRICKGFTTLTLGLELMVQADTRTEAEDREPSKPQAVH